jgi:hypothetical protein
MFACDLGERHGLAVEYDLSAINPHWLSPDSPTFQTGSFHPRLYPFDQKRPSISPNTTVMKVWN